MPMTLLERLMIRPPSRSRLPASRAIECALEVDRDELVEGVVGEFDDRREPHDACIIHGDVDAAEGLLGDVEHHRHPRRIGNICLSRDRFTACGCDPVHDFLRGFDATGIVHDDLEAVEGETLGNDSTDPAGGTRNQGHLVIFAHDFCLS
jgi:hypothetical protein